MGLFTDGFKLLKKASEPLYKTPKSIQETIEIMAVAENGIFEVSKNKYSKCYRFQDINYTTATEDEQIGIFERYCKFLNKNKNMEDLRDKVLITEKTMDSIITEESTMTLLRRRLLRADRGLSRRDT